MTEPAVGASVWASGSHVWTGNSGTLTAKATAKARNSQRPVDAATAWRWASVTRSKVTWPPRADRKTNASMPTSRKAEPNSVYRKNLSDA